MAVKTVEHKVTENANRIDGLRKTIAELGDRMDHRFESMEQHFDRRFEAVDRRFDTFDRRSLWLTGTLVATMLAVISILSAALLG